MTNSDFQSRIDAIIEIDAQPSEQVWVGLNSGCSREDLSRDLGYSLRYVDRLIADAFERRLLAGVKYKDLKRIIGENEIRCWTILLSIQPSSSRIYHAGEAAAALRAQVRELHGRGVSREGISRRLRLAEPTVRRLLVLGMLDEAAVDRVQRLMNSPKTKTKAFRWEFGKTTKTPTARKGARATIIRSSSSEAPPLDSEDAGRLRRYARRLHAEGHSLQEIQNLLALGTSASRALIAVALVESGWTLEASGTHVGLSRERVRQLVRASGLNSRVLKKNRRLTDRQSLAERQNLIGDWIRNHPGCRLDEIAAALQLNGLKKHELPNDAAHLVLGARSTNNWTTARFSRQATIAAIRQAFEIRNPLSSMYSEDSRRPVSGPYYDKLRRSGSVVGPSSARIIQVFGSWSTACELAGVPSPPPFRGAYSRKWTDDELIGHVAEFLTTTSSSSHEQFDRWAQQVPARPSFGTLRNQLRATWSEIIEMALLKLRITWNSDRPEGQTVEPV